jgi:hypothetical protein
MAVSCDPPGTIVLGFQLMGVLHPDRPFSPRHRRLNRVVLLISVLIGITLGLEWARECAAIQSSYLASYDYATSFFLTIALCIFGLILLIHWRTRWFGAGFIAVGILSYIMFLGGMAVLTREDRVAWRHEQMISIGPDQKASVVIYFRKGVTGQEVEDFNSAVLEVPTRQSPGHGHPAFVQTYLRLAPMQANGHEGIALTFFDNTSTDKVDAYLTAIKADKRVETVFLNTSPNSIHADSEHR